MKSPKTKFDIMSQCLKLFKQIPKIIDSFIDSMDNAQLVTLVKSNNQIKYQSELPLYHRFFCRLRQLTYSSFNSYMQTSNFPLIKQFLITINKQILSYKPNTSYEQLLVNISLAITKIGFKIAKNVIADSQQITQIFGRRIQYQPHAMEIEMKQYQRNSDKQKYKYKQKQKQKGGDKIQFRNKSQTTTDNSISKSIRYEIMGDIDPIYFQKLYTNHNFEDLLKDCLNRNKIIRSLIQKYQQKHKQYTTKPQNKKNRNSLDYCPTKYTIQMRRPYKKPTNFNRLSPSPPRKMKFINNKNNINIQPIEIITQEHPSSTLVDSDLIKQEILFNAFAYREKYKINKITIGDKDFQSISPDKLHQMYHTSKNFSNTPKSRTQRRQLRNNQSKSQKLKIKTNRAYIEGIISIPLREKN